MHIGDLETSMGPSVLFARPAPIGLERFFFSTRFEHLRLGLIYNQAFAPAETCTENRSFSPGLSQSDHSVHPFNMDTDEAVPVHGSR